MDLDDMSKKVLIITDTDTISGAEMLLKEYITRSPHRKNFVVLINRSEHILSFFTSFLTEDQIHQSTYLKKKLDPALPPNRISLGKMIRRCYTLIGFRLENKLKTILKEEDISQIIGNNTGDIFYSLFTKKYKIPFKNFIYDILPVSGKHRYIFKFFNPRIKKYIAASRAVQKSLTINGVPSAKIQVIYSGIDTPPPNRKPIKKESSIVFIGSICSRKRPLLFVKIFEKLHERKLIQKAYIIYKNRDTTVEKILEQYITDRNIQIEFIRDASRKTIEKQLLDAKFLVMTSTKDPFPTVVLEALRWGTPVIGSRGSGGVEECVAHKKNGFLFDPEEETFSELSSWISCLSTADYQKLSKNARKTAEQFPTSTWISKLEANFF